jgi:hypothetical protein
VWSPFYANASVNGNQLVISSFNQVNGVNTNIAVGATIIYNSLGITAGTTIISGPAGGPGTYTLSASFPAASGKIYGPNFAFGMYIASGSGPTYTIANNHNSGPTVARFERISSAGR